MRRVVITGQGIISPLGNKVKDYWENLLAGKIGFGPITHFDAEATGITLAAEVKEFDGAELGKKALKRMDLYSQYGVSAAMQAYEEAGLQKTTIDPKRFGVIVGTGIGGMTTLQNQVRVMDTKGPQRVTPFFVPMVIPNMIAGNLSLQFGAQNISQTVVTACASATNAIGEAFRKIKYGEADVMLTGGAEATICEIGISGFAALNALSKATDPERASIPFDKERHGFVMGEGAGMLILEELSHAQKRQATILAEVVGYGANCDAYHMTAPKTDGELAAEAMQTALNEAGITGEDVGYINAHGTSTPANDAAETTAIKRAFGAAAKEIPISSTKSMIGHLLGAAGAVEAIATVCTLRTGWAHPTANLRVADEACDLDYLPEAREIKPQYALSESFGFGGHNAVICLKKWEED